LWKLKKKKKDDLKVEEGQPLWKWCHLICTNFKRKVLFCFFAELEFELRASLARQVLYHWSPWKIFLVSECGILKQYRYSSVFDPL
jgi:hypothetical protein